ncbi:MAG: hypothetical protein CO094_06300 [Anaerolineae bacterium CG_4_9_14_3_um_filter_57_17]|nr:hypothetical protein [bacterium]NCT21623.1 hypothetical protein [bacterium]OIO85769.1 MAG: hypothetical protein AUK01_05100 [Anaerolineae bacterium CG2_30_57_67]PJB66662.1 MAG: hypothetical protein CO094_06300 [Anaerolineae bacterium CG_4_9_14_3_um_filter_57_17]
MFNFLKPKNQKPSDKRSTPRRKFSYYMCVTDDETDEILGQLTDINPLGFRIDSRKAIPIGKGYRLRMELTSEVSDQLYMVFLARCKWSAPDQLEPNVNNVGFEIVKIAPHEAEIFKNIVERYGE